MSLPTRKPWIAAANRSRNLVPLSKRQCEGCAKFYVPRGNRSKFCDECRPNRWRYYQPPKGSATAARARAYQRGRHVSDGLAPCPPDCPACAFERQEIALALAREPRKMPPCVSRAPSPTDPRVRR